MNIIIFFCILVTYIVFAYDNNDNINKLLQERVALLVKILHFNIHYSFIILQTPFL